MVEVTPEFYPFQKSDQWFLNNVVPTRYIANTSIVLRRPDTFRGIQQHRGNFNIPAANNSSYNRYGTLCTYTPTYWGEFDTLTEAEMGTVAEPGPGCPAGMLDLRKAVTIMQQQLSLHQLVRMEFNAARTIVQGQYLALDKNGKVVDSQPFDILRRIEVPAWTDYEHSWPLHFFTSLQTQYRGRSAARFSGPGVKYVMNSATLNVMYLNTNPYDFGKLGASACCVLPTVGWYNEQLTARGLGQIVINDTGWYDDAGYWNLFVPDGYVIVIGVRPDVKYPGNYFLTVVLNDCLEGPEQGMWAYYDDDCGRNISREIKVGMGHNGIVILTNPEMIIVAKVF
jgi:hypothetical protein